jgi:hypothetical protein
MEQGLGSHLLRVIAIDCDYEILYKKLLINPFIQYKPHYY